MLTSYKREGKAARQSRPQKAGGVFARGSGPRRGGREAGRNEGFAVRGGGSPLSWTGCRGGCGRQDPSPYPWGFGELPEFKRYMGRVMAKSRAGHCPFSHRPFRLPYWGSLQTAPNGVPTKRKNKGRAAAVPGQRFHNPEHCPINRTQKRPKNRLVRHCGQNAHNEFENLCNFLNKTPLRNGVFLVQ